MAQRVLVEVGEDLRCEHLSDLDGSRSTRHPRCRIDEDETKRDAGSNRAPEPLQLSGNGVGAGAKRREEITSLAIGHALDARAALEMLRDNAHAGQHAALAVAYDAGDFTRVGLCGGRRHCRQDQHNG